MRFNSSDNTLILPLQGIWRFQPDPYAQGERLDYAREEYDTSRWQEVPVPGNFEQYRPELKGYEGVCWFRRSFVVPENWCDRYVILHAEGINYRASIWVNGQKVGENEDGFLPFDLPLQYVLRFGENNHITLCVENTRRKGEVPGRQRGWRPLGGILRDLQLEAKNPTHFTEVRVFAEPTERGGKFGWRTLVANHGAEAVQAEMRVRLLEQGRRIAEWSIADLVLAPGTEEDCAFETELFDILPWSPEKPARYTAQFALLQKRVALHTHTVRFGFRNIAVREGRLELNGKPIFLTGFNRHEDTPHADMGLDVAQVRADLLQMKSLGANFIRLCHYPHHPQELELCDELGLLAMGEIPLYWWDGRAEGAANCARKLDAAKRQLTRLIARDFHHPSLILWSVSNETQESRPEVVAGNAELVRLAQELDPTRLATHVSDKWTQHPHFEPDAVICVNGYPSWSGRCWQNNPHYDVTESTKWWKEKLGALHERYPDKPILIAEFGYPALSGVFDNALGEEMQAAAIEAEFRATYAPYVCGTTLWCYADHPWPEEDFLQSMTMSPFGIVTRDRKPKRALATVQGCFWARHPVPALFMRRADLKNLPEVILPPDCLLREGSAADFDGLADLLRRAFGDARWTLERVHTTFQEDPSVLRILVVERQGQVVATASVRLLPEEFPGSGYVHWVAADPKLPGMGLGYQVSLATLHEFAALGCQDAVLETNDFRLPAVNTYLKLGFQPEDRHESHTTRWKNLLSLIQTAREQRK